MACLARNGADVTAPDSNLMAPLDLAAVSGNASAAAELLECRDVDPNASRRVARLCQFLFNFSQSLTGDSHHGHCARPAHPAAPGVHLRQRGRRAAPARKGRRGRQVGGQGTHRAAQGGPQRQRRVRGGARGGHAAAGIQGSKFNWPQVRNVPLKGYTYT